MLCLLLPLIAQAAPALSLSHDASQAHRLSTDGVASFSLISSSKGTVQLQLLGVREGDDFLPGKPLVLSSPSALTLTSGGLCTLEFRESEAGRLPPGEYTLDLLSTNARGGQDRLTLRVEVPPALLRVSQSPVVLDVIRPLWGPPPSSAPYTVQVEELGRQRGVRELLVSPQGGARGADGAISGALFTAPKDIRIDAGETAELGLTPVANAPLGTSSVTLELRAPELAAPLSLPVELRVRRPAWLLLVAAALGASVQLLQKLVLPALNVRLAEDREIRRLQDFIGRAQKTPDEPYKQRLDRARDLLPRTLSLLNPLSWLRHEQELNQARDLVEEAVRQLNQRREVLRAEVDGLHDLLSRRFQLPGLVVPARDEQPGAGPSSARAAITRAAALEQTAREHLERDETDEAQRAIQEAMSAINQALELSRRWSDAVVRELDNLDMLPAKIPQPTPPSLISHHAAALKALKSDAIVGATGLSTPESALGSLVAVHNAKRLTKPLVQAHARNLRMVAESLRNALGAKPEALEKLNEQWKPFQPRTDTTSDIQAVCACAESLYRGVEAAMRQLSGGKLSDEGKKLLEDGQYAEAIRALGLSYRDPSELYTLSGQGEEETEAVEPPTPTEQPRKFEYSAILTPPPPARQPPPRSVLVVILETTAACVVLGGLVWSTYAAHFVGTVGEMLGIFAFVYGSNLGLDSVLGQLKGQVKEPEPETE